ncbi:hypothetical protein E4U58_002856 [Claviceps cyperi]|nr:hypothetical protein E4U58_002856 [Claviceps cyperi]
MAESVYPGSEEPHPFWLGFLSTLPVTRMMELMKSDCGFEADIAIIELLQRFYESRRFDFATTRGWLSKDLLSKTDMLNYLAYESNRPQPEQKIDFATQGMPKKSRTSKKNTPPHDPYGFGL